METADSSFGSIKKSVKKSAGPAPATIVEVARNVS
jgi:hypothetical protein